jgi:hypothetical protein
LMRIIPNNRVYQYYSRIKRPTICGVYKMLMANMRSKRIIKDPHSKRGKRNRDGSHQKGAGTLPDVSRKFPCHF